MFKMSIKLTTTWSLGSPLSSTWKKNKNKMIGKEALILGESSC